MAQYIYRLVGIVNEQSKRGNQIRDRSSIVLTEAEAVKGERRRNKLIGWPNFGD